MYQYTYKNNPEGPPYWFSADETNDNNWTRGSIAFYAFDREVPGTVPVYQYTTEDNRGGPPYWLTTANTNDQGWLRTGTAFHCYREGHLKTDHGRVVPVYQYSIGDHRDAPPYWYSTDETNDHNWFRDSPAFYAFPKTLQAYPRLGPEGGRGGQGFDDTRSLNGPAPITQVMVRHGSVVDGLGFGYDGAAPLYHGGTAGSAVTENLDPKDSIVEVRGSWGQWDGYYNAIFNLEIVMKSGRRLGPYGNGHGMLSSQAFSLVVPDGERLLALFGETTEKKGVEALTQIGVTVTGT
ncbi:MAG: hypothetical protein KUG77_00715 [Nannocystaceae bacterium]|nr:hypothetical protein [Nannocystaceae bacterium]